MTKSTHTWQFASRFRRNAFGWRSDLPIKRIKEAVAEIRKVARTEPIVAAEGAVKFLEKISASLGQVDSSSGAMTTAVNRAIETLVPVIAKAEVDLRTRRKWLERLWIAIDEDEISYSEYIGDFWGDLCASAEIANEWADRFLHIVHMAWNDRSGFGYFKGTIIVLASLFAAGRHEELLTLVATARAPLWNYREWAVKALVAQGKMEEALRYAQDSEGRNMPSSRIAATCESILLSMGRIDDAYEQYALAANIGQTNLATFRAIAKRYPHKSDSDILRDLVVRHPGSEGKWFAAAKDAELFDMAVELAARSPTDPLTLTRAARDFATSRPTFAQNCALIALHWIARGHGYEITGADVRAAYDAAGKAAEAGGADQAVIAAKVTELMHSTASNAAFLRSALSTTTLR